MPKHPLLVLGSNDAAALKLLSDKLREHGHWPHVEAPESFTPELEHAVTDFQMTHLGRRRAPLDVDGVVGDDTWWALFNAVGEPQRSHITARIPNGLGPQRKSLLEVALAEHAKDVHEDPPGSNRGAHVDRYLPEHFRDDEKGPPWCCFFYSWVAKEALGGWPLGRREGGCASARALAGRMGLWIPKYLAAEKQHPIPGDAFVMDKGSGHGHIGYVLRVSEDGRSINTLEGNCGNRVKLGLRALTDPQIVGYIDNVPGEQNVGFERGVVEAAHVGQAATR
jgi:hypothetical protein